MGEVNATPELTQGKRESGDPSCNNSVKNLKKNEVEVEVTATSISSSSSSFPSSILDETKHEAVDELILPEQRGLNDTYRRLTRAFSPLPKAKIHAEFGCLDVFFSVYREMFAVIFTVNLTIFVVLVAKSKGYPTLSNVKDATSANILACVMMRQENVVNFMFDVTTWVPLSTPFFIRKKLAKVFHYGGVHSGCGVAAVVWFILYTVLTTRNFVQMPTGGLPVANLVTCYILVTMYLFIILAAHPSLRRRYHDYFEAVHRFAGWTSFVILWTQTFILAVENARSEKTNVGLVLVQNPGFWFLLTSTSFIALSWGRLRHREVRAEVLSSHATRLHFTYKDMPPYYGLKVSDRPLLEWHAFATIPEPDGKGFSFVVSNAGDWTTKVIKTPPKKLWTRGFPVHGPLYGARLFRRVVLVATGSGIGPCMSLLVDNKIPHRILWSTRNPEITYGKGIIDTVLKADPKAVIWNTTEKGYPDIVMETYKLYVESGAEAVYIISNPKVTRKVVFGLESRGIAAYGPIFDS